MVACRKEEDAARYRQEKREAYECRKVVIIQGSVEPPKRHRLASLTRQKEYCASMGTRRNETCVR